MKGYFKSRCSFMNLCQMSLLLNSTLKALHGEKKNIFKFCNSNIAERGIFINQVSEGYPQIQLCIFKNLISSDACKNTGLQLGCWYTYTVVYNANSYYLHLLASLWSACGYFYSSVSCLFVWMGSSLWTERIF